MLKLIKVALDIPINELFDYFSDDVRVSIGSRVKVPFGKTVRLGVIIDIKRPDNRQKKYITKNIEMVIDDHPILSHEMIKICKWASSYYHHPIGQVIFSVITPLYRKIRKEPKSKLLLSSQKVSSTLKLNDEQNKVFNVLTKNKFNVSVIRGITGSGKTELYIKIADEILKRNKQVLILVPEINLVPQTIERFKRYLSIEPIEYHSNLTVVQKYKVSDICKSEGKLIVVGTRSSVFLPFENLGLVVVDEEHDSSYKQTDSLKYNARDLGILRSRNSDCPVILGSATPSFETTLNIKNGKYNEFRLEKRFHKSSLPLVTIVDSSIDRPEEGISNILRKSIKKELDNNKKIILFLGRRGFSNTVICSNCKTIVKCPRCDTYMTYHKGVEKLICHACGYKEEFKQVKKCCDDPVLSPLGVGTERLESKIKKLFPGKNILRVDSDSISNKKDLENFFKKARNNEIDIYIGTQMIVKGHDFDDISLVGIINIDSGLYSTDFRGLEKTAQLITQVAGRAGRQTQQGNVFIQTYNPNHRLLQIILHEGYEKFSEEAMRQRKSVNLPPYSHIGLLKVTATNKNYSRSILQNIKNFQMHKDVFVYGPYQSKVFKINNQYSHQLLLGSRSIKLLSGHMNEIEIYLSSLNKKISWHIDIDPLEV